MNPKQNVERATWATWWLGFGGWEVWSSPELLVHHPIASLVIAGGGGLALVYLCVGLKKATADPDPMSKFWPAVFLIAAGLLMGEGCYLPREWRFLNTLLQGCYIAVLAAAGVRFILVMRPLPSNELPDPSKVAGMPMSGPASRQAAHASLRRGNFQRPKFRT
jgi:hypothetical protein